MTMIGEGRQGAMRGVVVVVDIPGSHCGGLEERRSKRVSRSSSDSSSECDAKVVNV
jgi:hypothetical protein